MIIIIFVILDLIALINIVGLHFELISDWRFPMASVAYLIIKAIMFKGEFFSVIDALIGIYMFFMVIFGINFFIDYIIMAYFGYKIGLSFILSH
ncbi:MAG: hypothetical protein QXG00_01975 [Candidatus Woesearchaeota archaeon]